MTKRKRGGANQSDGGLIDIAGSALTYDVKEKPDNTNTHPAKLEGEVIHLAKTVFPDAICEMLQPSEKPAASCLHSILVDMVYSGELSRRVRNYQSGCGGELWMK